MKGEASSAPHVKGTGTADDASNLPRFLEPENRSSYRRNCLNRNYPACLNHTTIAGLIENELLALE